MPLLFSGNDLTLNYCCYCPFSNVSFDKRPSIKQAAQFFTNILSFIPPIVFFLFLLFNLYLF